jgi:hypothetical protein
VVKPGGSIRVFGTGFDPTRPVVIQFQQNNQTISPINSPLRGPAANGTISVDATIPSSAEAGQAFILACIGTPSGSTGACSQPQQITVQKP